MVRERSRVQFSWAAPRKIAHTKMDLTSKTYLLSQAFAIMAMIVYMASQQYKKRQSILVGFVLGNILNAIHMILLGAMTGMTLALIGAVRFTVAIFSTHKGWLVFFLAINTIATYFVFEGYLLSLTSYLGATFIIISSFLESDNHMRICMILGGIAWTVYTILVSSIIGTVANSLFVVSSLLGWYRYRNIKQVLVRY